MSPVTMLILRIFLKKTMIGDFLSVVKLGKYMEAEFVEEKPKTQVWQVKSKSDGSKLGVIKWFAPWRQYCFFTVDVSVFSARCLRDFASFLEKLNQHHKAR